MFNNVIHQYHQARVAAIPGCLSRPASSAVESHTGLPQISP
ncbi:MAG: hypothetical protein PHV59_12120 [Victivallales bacterium]|nr:hypothetical protein [Victivallales bacterium]